ncbi:hypothetical protein ACJJJB_10680 [Microbulbifer sp. ANSA001]|uniref:hypothetical protein n=1 Tax=Microbulbifer sp. ANSA001 TaxID=3243358 RepID=UPI004040EF69
MKLNHPKSKMAFEPSPGWFLGPFDIYDREESLGEKLNEYDPLESNQLQNLFDEYFFKECGYATKHKAAMVKCLVEALSEDAYDFSIHLPNYEDEENYFFLPSSWEFSRPRYIFEQAYIASVRHWGNELKETGLELPDAKQLGIGKCS